MNHYKRMDTRIKPDLMGEKQAKRRSLQRELCPSLLSRDEKGLEVMWKVFQTRLSNFLPNGSQEADHPQQ